MRLSDKLLQRHRVEIDAKPLIAAHSGNCGECHRGTCRRCSKCWHGDRRSPSWSRSTARTASR